MFLAMTVLYGGLALTIPESPRYLVSRMRLDATRDVFRPGPRQYRRRRQGGDPADAQPRAASEVGGPARLALGLMPIVWVGIGLSVFQQFVAINVIFYYSTVLWQP